MSTIEHASIRGSLPAKDGTVQTVFEPYATRPITQNRTRTEYFCVDFCRFLEDRQILSNVSRVIHGGPNIIKSH